jgi:VanZ like protein
MILFQSLSLVLPLHCDRSYFCGQARVRRPCCPQLKPSVMLDFWSTRRGFLLLNTSLVHTTNFSPPERNAGWSNRFLIAALAGILFLTLFPFRFDFQSRPLSGPLPFLLGGGVKTWGTFDVFLNVLLFVPFGFGLAEKLREKKVSRLATLVVVWAAGGIFSYAIELAQFYMPMRDSGWEDVVSNSTGSLLGFFLFDILGAPIIGFLSRCEAALRSSLTPARVAVFLSIYFLSWFALSGVLQMQTRLSNWDPDCLLLVGNEAGGQSPWKGQVQQLQIADRAVSDLAALRLTSGEIGAVPPISWRAEYNFSGTAPFKDTRNHSPALSWVPPALSPAASDPPVLNGKSWLSSRAPMSTVVVDLQKTNQFAIHLICAAEETHSGRGHIVSIARSPLLAHLTIRQEESNLVFWFRSPLSAKHAILGWYIPNVFNDTQARNLLYSYDGSDLSLFINGKKISRLYRLGPGTSLARILRMVRPAELQGYNDIYYSLVFFPAGIILGIAAQKYTQSTAANRLIVILYLLLPGFLLEFILVRVSGRPVWISNALLSVCLMLAGFFWIRTDSSSSGRRSAANPQVS